MLLNSCMPGMGESCAAFGGKGKIFHDRKGEILAVLRRLQREFSNQDAGYDAMIRLLLWQLVIHSVRLIGIQVPGVRGWRFPGFWRKSGKTRPPLIP